MATVGGRPILDAMIMLLCANQWFGVTSENALPSLLLRSREYQGTVTEDLAEQVFSGLEALLRGFQTASIRDNSSLLHEAHERQDDHLYHGLLTIMLRLVFVLYAEDRCLLPIDHTLYSKQMSLLGLFERLQRDHGNFPDSMHNRFGAWGHIVSLSRAIYFGAEHGEFKIPPRQGDLFDPHRYPFIEGWIGPSAPVITHKARSQVKVPSVDDGTVFALLSCLLIFQGQRLSYRTLAVEQIGSVYEALMGYQVGLCGSPAVAIKVNGKRGAPKYWVQPDLVLAHPPSGRLKWLKNNCGFDNTVATKIKKALDEFNVKRAVDQSSIIEALLPLAAGKQGHTHEQRANTGQYVLQPGSERRSSGTNYTPRSMTKPIVRKTLKPLLQRLGEKPSADQVLELKICDPAMGSGAFLVESCRQLADEVVAAWGRTNDVENIAAQSPEGDVVAHARRLVAQRCLYGVDKNPMAVPLAKLSLWLFTLARDLPFTFLDHSLRHGDSLVGLELDQIKAFHWEPERQLSFLELEIDRLLDEVVSIRNEIHKLAEDSTPEGQRLKAQRLFDATDATDATDRVRRVADLCVGVFFSKTSKRERLIVRQTNEDNARLWLDGDIGAAESVFKFSNAIRKQHAPFHWSLEFPEVFLEHRNHSNICEGSPAASFDAFVGNPPFMGKNTITKSWGPQYPDWLRTTLPGNTGVRGACDLCAYFFRKSINLVAESGTIGLVATNTIAQGDTRSIGLQHILEYSEASIYEAVRSIAWPGDAAVTVSIVHIAIGAAMNENVSCRLDGRCVPVINSRLRPKPERPDAKKLASNLGLASQGSILLGDGFILTPDEYRSLSECDPANRERIFPYIGGDEVNTSPTQAFSRYVIDFEDRSLEECESWPKLIEIVRDLVKPERDKQKGQNATSRRRRDVWWQYTARCPELYEALTPLDHCLAIPQQFPNVVRVDIQPTGRVFSQKLIVLPVSEHSTFAILQSRIHNSWVEVHCGRMGAANTPVYTHSGCFNNFPFPEANPKTEYSDLDSLGKILYETRSDFMRDTSQGLTKTYNHLIDNENFDKDVVKLRQLHEKLDRAVLEAYGWLDIDVPPYCPVNTEEKNALDEFVDEVVDRLYLLNISRSSTVET